MIIKSGGQTGVDRAALDIARKLNIPHGGWCPKGRLAEDGIISTRYLLKETFSSDYKVRTKLNVKDSDGTLIIVPETPIKGCEGTSLAAEEAKKRGKPRLILNLSKNIDIVTVTEWFQQNKIVAINIVGPRESQCPSIYLKSLDFLEKLFSYVLAHEIPEKPIEDKPNQFRSIL